MTHCDEPTLLECHSNTFSSISTWEHTLPSDIQTSSYSGVLNRLSHSMSFSFCQTSGKERSFTEPHTVTPTKKTFRRGAVVVCMRLFSFSPQRSLWSLVLTEEEAGHLSLQHCWWPAERNPTFVHLNRLLSQQGSVYWSFVPFWHQIYYLRWWIMSHDKMCTKRMARPMLSRITMQIMMVFGPLKRQDTYELRG